MIGVIANSSDHAVIAEFFELFKTPWEFYKIDRRYEVVLCAAKQNPEYDHAKLVLLYVGHELPADAEESIEIASRRSNRMFSYNGTRLPIYGESITFRGEGSKSAS